MPANTTDEPIWPLATRCARHVISHPERFLHLPPRDREDLFARQWSILRRARNRPALGVFSGEGGAA